VIVKWVYGRDGPGKHNCESSPLPRRTFEEPTNLWQIETRPGVGVVSRRIMSYRHKPLHLRP
jgi:hypothetical protein